MNRNRSAGACPPPDDDAQPPQAAAKDARIPSAHPESVQGSEPAERHSALSPQRWTRAKHRFFVPPEAREGTQIHFSPHQARQLARVLRLQRGEVVIALDGSGAEWLVRLNELSDRRAVGTIEAERSAPGEPSTHLTLYQALLPRDKFELVLQKGTEIGVSAFVPLVAERSLARERLSPSRLERWQTIVREAAEQARRGRVPTVHQATPLAQALDAVDKNSLNLFAWERATRPLNDLLRAAPLSSRPVSLWIGPEGGFSESEARQAEAAGLLPVSLGPRILRTETAGLVLAALVLYEAGDLS